MLAVATAGITAAGNYCHLYYCCYTAAATRLPKTEVSSQPTTAAPPTVNTGIISMVVAKGEKIKDCQGFAIHFLFQHFSKSWPWISWIRIS
jgi:hypothetical protein